MIDQDFCEFLEPRLTKAFRQSEIAAIKHFLCDGVLLPFNENELLPVTVNKSRRITLQAFCGYDGQDKYDLILEFGNKSLSRYMRGLDIKECLPEDNTTLTVDVDQKTLKLVLL